MGKQKHNKKRTIMKRTGFAWVALSLVACAQGPSSPPTATAATVEVTPAPRADIIDTASSAGSFETLVAAIKAADLEATLRGPGPFTVFAPTDEAFAKLPKGTVEDLLKPENKAKLQSILTYHVVAGRVNAKDVVKLTHAKTVQGKELAISTSGGVKVDAANVIKTDIECSNGVIHVIDAVVLP
jgi:transforming growth factor-beta-induced protein